MGIIAKSFKAFEKGLDQYIAKAEKEEDEYLQNKHNNRKALVELETNTNNNGGVYRERYTLAGPAVLKNMARISKLFTNPNS